MKKLLISSIISIITPTVVVVSCANSNKPIPISDKEEKVFEAQLSSLSSPFNEIVVGKSIMSQLSRNSKRTRIYDDVEKVIRNFNNKTTWSKELQFYEKNLATNEEKMINGDSVVKLNHAYRVEALITTINNYIWDDKEKGQQYTTKKFEVSISQNSVSSEKILDQNAFRDKITFKNVEDYKSGKINAWDLIVNYNGTIWENKVEIIVTLVYVRDSSASLWREKRDAVNKALPNKEYKIKLKIYPIGKYAWKTIPDEGENIFDLIFVDSAIIAT